MNADRDPRVSRTPRVALLLPGRTVPGARWFCSRDDGSVRAEIMIEAGTVEVCLWRCEDMNAEIEATLRDLGLDLDLLTQGPCLHE